MSSSVGARSRRGGTCSRRRSALVDPLSSQISGAAALATNVSGRATRIAIASGLLKAMCLGPSSPITRAV